MVAITIKIDGLTKLNRKIGRMNTKLGTMSIMSFGQAVAKKARSELRKAYVPDREQTGNLEKGIRPYSLEAGKRVVVVASAESDKGYDYARIVEEGRGSMRKTNPKVEKPFRFIGREGFPVYTYFVKGTTGKRYMEKASEWARAEMARYVRKRVRRIIKSGGHADDYNVASAII